MENTSPKLCECGCGLPAPIATNNSPKQGRVKGQPQRFIKGHHGRKPHVTFTCKQCGKVKEYPPSTARAKGAGQYCSRACLAKSRKGGQAAHWQGGDDYTIGGYRVLYVEGYGRDFEHRIVMMQHLGRPLAPDEHVHHKDGNKLNNAIENLQLMTESEHRRLHADQRRGKPRKPR